MFFRNPDIVLYLPDISWLIGFHPLKIMMTSFIEICRVTEEMELQQQFLAVTMALGLPAENVTGGWLLQVLLKKRNDP